MRYVSATLRSERDGWPVVARRCCTRMVWTTERRKHPAEVCDRLLTGEEKGLELAVDEALREESRAARRDAIKAEVI